MTRERADLGFGAALNDLGSFDTGAKQVPISRPAKEEVASVALAAGFRSREAKAPVPLIVHRRRRTGRNVQFNIKTTPEAISAFCAIADANGWGLGETLERAVELLQAQRTDRKS